MDARSELLEKTTQLETYALLQDDKYGDYCLMLVSLAQHTDFMTPIFLAALDQAITEELTNFKENTTIVHTEAITTHPVTTLEWA